MLHQLPQGMDTVCIRSREGVRVNENNGGGTFALQRAGFDEFCDPGEGANNDGGHATLQNVFRGVRQTRLIGQQASGGDVRQLVLPMGIGSAVAKQHSGLVRRFGRFCRRRDHHDDWLAGAAWRASNPCRQRVMEGTRE